MYVRLSDGALRNAYTIRIVNKQLKYRDFIVERRRPAVDADRFRRPAAARRRPPAGRPSAPTRPREVRVTVTDYSATPPAPSTSILFTLIDIDTGEVAQMRDHFFGP